MKRLVACKMFARFWGMMRSVWRRREFGMAGAEACKLLETRDLEVVRDGGIGWRKVMSGTCNVKELG